MNIWQFLGKLFHNPKKSSFQTSVPSLGNHSRNDKIILILDELVDIIESKKIQTNLKKNFATNVYGLNRKLAEEE